MSSNLPPQDGGNGAGGSQDGPEYLEQGSGEPIAEEKRSSSRKPLLIGAAAVVGLGLVGTGVFAATRLAGGGAQPSEALPASTLAYASIDLDPSAGQKIEAIRTLRKFPALDEKLDLNSQDDLRKRLFEEIQKDDECKGVDYAQDIEPWLGERAAAAMVESAGKPTGVGVLAITDADAAEAGVAKLQKACGGSGDTSGAFVIDGDWMVMAETKKVAQQVVDGAAKGTLADDESFQRWTGEVGDPGIVTMYAAKGAMPALVRLSAAAGDQMPPDAEDQMSELTKDFKGAAATVRFDDGALELEAASEGSGGFPGLKLTNGAGPLVADLPADTVGAFGVALPDGWGEAMLQQMSTIAGGQVDTEQMVSQLEAQTGLSLPEDVETLTGDALVLAVGGDIDPETLANSQDPSDIPVGVKAQGNPGEIEKVLEKIRTASGAPADGPLSSQTKGDLVAVGPNKAYLDDLLAGGDLAGSEVYQDVTGGQEDAAAVLFVNFNGAGDWLASLAEGQPEVQENLKPLAAAGMTAWMDGDVSHSTLRVTTD